jgi:hypothetical protein
MPASFFPGPLLFLLAYWLAHSLAYCSWDSVRPTFLWLKSLCSALFSPRIVLTLDSAGVTIGCSGLTIGWEEIDSMERVLHNRREHIPFSRRRVIELNHLLIKPLDERCAARWKESWRLTSRRSIPLWLLAIKVLNSGIVFLPEVTFPSVKLLDESLRELYCVFHGGELRVNDTEVRLR